MREPADQREAPITMPKIRQCAVVILALLPMLSHLFENGQSAFTMYARSVWFRLEIVARDDQGRARPLPPTALAHEVVPSAASFLAGSDHFRRAYSLAPARRHLADIARLACAREQTRAAAVEIVLVERTGLSGPTVETRENVRCAP